MNDTFVCEGAAHMKLKAIFKISLIIGLFFRNCRIAYCMKFESLMRIIFFKINDFFSKTKS
jgi:hypothetical protein